MSETLCKDVHYKLGHLTNNIGPERIGLPGIQRPFAWVNAQVRDLLDSMFRGAKKLAGGVA